MTEEEIASLVPSGEPPPKVVTFWQWIPTDERYQGIRLAIGGDPVRFHHSTQHEEGWSSWSAEYKRSDCGWYVECSEYSDGTDCDGRMSTEWHGQCHVSKLASSRAVASLEPNDESEGLKLPEWTCASRGQRDYSAEAAGY